MSQYWSALRVLRTSRYPLGFDAHAASFNLQRNDLDSDGRRCEILEEIAAALRDAGDSVTNIQAVVAGTHVSHQEIHQLFGGFTGLLNALIERLAQSMLAPLESDREAGNEFLPTLIAFGQRVTDSATALQLKALYRIAITDTIRDTRLGQDFYARGPGRVLAGLASFLSSARSAGVALDGDSHQLASHLMALLKAYSGLPDGVASHELDELRACADVSQIIGLFCLGIQQEMGNARAAS